MGQHDSIASFANNLSKRLVKEDYRIISGFGNTIGSLIINGALEEIFKSKYKHVDEHLYLRPFPQVELETDSKEEIWQKYREDMIGESGIAIFIFGNKCENEDVKIADGMIKEFYIACEQNKLIIPVGSTESHRLYKRYRLDLLPGGSDLHSVHQNYKIPSPPPH